MADTPRTIWKFPLAITDQQAISMPSYADIVSVQRQGDSLCLWAIVAPENPQQRRDIRIVGTGHPMPDDRLVFIATVQDGPFVWHVFEAFKASPGED